MPPDDDPLEQLKALKRQGALSRPAVADTTDPLEQLKALKANKIGAGVQPSTLDQRGHRESTAVTPAPATRPSAPGNDYGLLDQALSGLTLGAHAPIVGVGDAIGDILQHGLNAHPIDTFGKSVQATHGRENAAAQAHPVASPIAQGAGTLASLLASGPLGEAIGATEQGIGGARQTTRLGNQVADQAAEQASTAPGFRAGLRRVGQSAKTGGVTGATIGAVGGLGSNPADATGQVIGGGLVGGLLGGGSQAAGELGSGATSLLKSLLGNDSEQRGSDIALGRINTKLNNDRLDPSDLLPAADKANAISAPARVAHLGGPSLDNLTFNAAIGNNPESASLRANIKAAQEGEHDLLQLGLTNVSGIADTPVNRTENYLPDLKDQRKAAGKVGYPKAYDAPPITDPAILSAIDKDPDLGKALSSGRDIMRRRQEADALLSGEGQPGPTASIGSLPPEIQNDPKMIAILRAKGYLPSEESAGTPVKDIDYMKRGVKKNIQAGLKSGDLDAFDAGSLNDKVKAILQSADQVSPKYGEVRAEQQGFFQRIKAGETGANAFNKTGEAIGQERGALPTPDADLSYRTTGTSQLRGLLEKKKSEGDLSNNLFGPPVRQKQVEALYGPEGSSALEPYLEQGRTLNRVQQAVGGNSKTAERVQSQGETNDQQAGIDALHVAVSPHRAFYNIPAKIQDRKNKAAMEVMTRVLAQKLNIPADSPDLPAFVEELYRRQAGESPSALGTGGRRTAFSLGSGVLGGLLSNSALGSARQ